MKRVIIYLDDDIEEKMSAAAKAAHLSKSKWVAGLIKAKAASEWPKSITELAGAWKDLSVTEKRRGNLRRRP